MVYWIYSTKWVDSTWETINLKYPNFRRKSFLNTGLLMTADGTDDEYIQPQRFTNYSFLNAALSWLSLNTCYSKNIFNNNNIQCKIYHCLEKVYFRMCFCEMGFLKAGIILYVLLVTSVYICCFVLCKSLKDIRKTLIRGFSCWKSFLWHFKVLEL